MRPKTGVPALTAARLQRWALLLSAYGYTIEFWPTLAHANADWLSRLPHPGYNNQRSRVNQDHQALPVSAAQLRRATQADPVMSTVHQFTQLGWPAEVSDDLKPFWQVQAGLSVEVGCVLRGIGVVVPAKHRVWVLDMLHEGHMGIVRMKALARSYLWWPGLGLDLEKSAKTCPVCQVEQKAPPGSPLHLWLWPTWSWACVHLDFAGPFQGRMLLVVVNLSSFLLAYRATPQATTSVPPAVLSMGRNLHTCLDLLCLNVGIMVAQHQVGQEVLVCAYQGSFCWVPAIVVRALGPVSVTVRTS